MSPLKLPSIRQLHRQLMLSPADVRERYAGRLERFLLELEPALTYSYEFVYFRIVGVRLDVSRLDTFSGAELAPDLLLLLDALSAEAAPPVRDAGEEVYAIDDLRARFGVTARTVHRWRRRGLVSRRYTFPDGARRVGVRKSALERFIAANRGALPFTSRSSRLTQKEEADIVRRVERLRDQGLSTTAAAAQVAGDVGRARETVRLALKRAGGGPPARPPLGERERRELLADYRRGTAAEELAARSGRSAASVYRILNQERARELLGRTVSYVGGKDFEAPAAQDGILSEGLRALVERLEAASAAPGGPAGPPGRPPLSRDEERGLFHAYNYTKYLFLRARGELDPSRYVATQALREVDDLAARARRLKDLIVRLHQSLMERIVRQHAAGPVGAPELLSQGRALLGELAETFDYNGRGRFAALVTLDLQKAFARIMAERAEGAAGAQ